MNKSVQVDMDDLTDPKDEVKLTTPGLQDLLAAKYPRDRYALFFDVPDNVGTNQRRRADAIAVGCWNSVGHLVEGFELKVSRSDWLREVSSVNKSDPFIERCDRWWLVTSSPTIAKLEEVPACWGWMAATKGGLRVQRPAARLPQDDDRLNRLFVIGLLRKLQESLTNSPEVRQLVESVRKDAESRLDERVQSAVSRISRSATEAEARIEKFEKAAGFKLEDWRFGKAGTVIRQLSELSYKGEWRTALAEELQSQEKALTTHLEHLRAAQAILAKPLSEEAAASASER